MPTVQELSARIDRLETDVWKAVDKLRDQIERIQNRPPVWASILISCLMFALGIAARAAF